MSDAPPCAEPSRPIDADFAEFRRTHDRALRNELIERHLGIAYHLAGRYRRRGVADEDLQQVAMIGLLKAVERFDPEHGSSFSSFATPTILGELRRYFRDYTWAVRVPRQLQERVLVLGGVVGTLTQQLGRSPSTKEISIETGLTEEEILEALEADGAYGTTPLEPASDSGYRPDASAWLADEPESRTDQVVERRLLAASLLSELSPREQEIVELRFARGLTQSEIAEHVGVSQMQVSRLLTRRAGEDASGARRRRRLNVTF